MRAESVETPAPPDPRAQTKAERVRGLIGRLSQIEEGEHWERAVESALVGIFHLIEASQSPNADELVDVVIEGVAYRVPAALREGYMLKADYTRKTTELAERRRALQAEATRLNLGPLKGLPPAPGNVFASATYNALKEGH